MLDEWERLTNSSKWKCRKRENNVATQHEIQDFDFKLIYLLLLLGRKVNGVEAAIGNKPYS